MFVGAFGGVVPNVVQLLGGSFGELAILPANANQLIQFHSNGFVQDNGVDNSQWLLIGPNSNYELFVHNDGPDALLAGTLDTWQVLSTTRTYQLQRLGASGVGTKTAVLACQIRDAASLAVLATGSWTLQVVVDA